jgi:hypothetical protein
LAQFQIIALERLLDELVDWLTGAARQRMAPGPSPLCCGRIVVVQTSAFLYRDPVKYSWRQALSDVKKFIGPSGTGRAY